MAKAKAKAKAKKLQDVSDDELIALAKQAKADDLLGNLCEETGEPCQFEVDWEYDSTGGTASCIDCGESRPTEESDEASSQGKTEAEVKAIFKRLDAGELTPDQAYRALYDIDDSGESPFNTLANDGIGPDIADDEEPYQTTDEVAATPTCTQTAPCQGRYEVDQGCGGLMWACRILPKEGSWALYNDDGALVAFITHCPWCGRRLE